MNSDEAERLVREMVEVGDESVYKPAVKALLEFHEMNKTIIGDRAREVKDLEEQLTSVAAEVERLRAENESRRIALAMVAQYVGNMDERTMHYAAKHLRAERDLFKAKVAELEAESAELTRLLSEYREEQPKLEARVVELEDDRAALAVAGQAFKARLAWFEERETAVRQDVASCADREAFGVKAGWSAVHKWDAEHPKPE